MDLFGGDFRIVSRLLVEALYYICSLLAGQIFTVYSKEIIAGPNLDIETLFD